MKEKITRFVCLLLICGPLLALTGRGKATTKQELETFLKRYVDATNSHNFANVQPLLTPDAIYWFNKNESQGIPAIKANFEASWSYLPDEVYGIKDIRWLTIEKNSATCVYTYTYRGTHNAQPMQGSGRGTSILVKVAGSWRIAHEHLSIPQ